MNYFKCDCGSILFEQVVPQVFDPSEVRVWHAGALMRCDHTSISLLKCLKCNKLHIPSCSLLGKNALDKDVQIYKELISIVEAYNKNLYKPIDLKDLEMSISEYVPDVTKEDIERLENEILNLKEIINVKTSKRSKKDT